MPRVFRLAGALLRYFLAAAISDVFFSQKTLHTSWKLLQGHNIKFAFSFIEISYLFKPAAVCDV
jgi:hypothetical protein